MRIKLNRAIFILALFFPITQASFKSPFNMLSASLLQLVTSLGLLFNNVNGLPALSYESLGQPIVDLGYSQYQGKTLSSGVNQYLGMRFAAPPVGDLRFRAPSEPLKTTGLQNATAVCCICHLLTSC